MNYIEEDTGEYITDRGVFDSKEDYIDFLINESDMRRKDQQT